MFFQRIKRNAVLATLLVAALATSTVGCKGKKDQKSGEQPASVSQNLTYVRGTAPGEKDSDEVPIGDAYVKGPADAPITIVEYSDFQCPFCKRGHDTLEKLLEKYPGKIRVAYRNYPLPFHKQAVPAAYAALAAGEQGKFAEMHDKLFEVQSEIGSHANDMKEWTTELAKGLGMDPAKFAADYDKISKSDALKADEEAAEKLSVNGTPAYFINGHSVSGAQPLDNFDKIVKEELEMIEKLGGSVAQNDLYSTRVKANFKKPAPPTREEPKQVVEMVPVVEGDPVRGNSKDPLVTIVEFSDFQCPFCSRVTPTLKQIEDNFGKQVRVIFKQNPLGFHSQAEPAARAAIAAGNQGKFWEMHDKLFENQKSLGTPDIFNKFAAELGLNVDKFKKDFDSDAAKQKVKDDLALGSKVGARGTPNFFINGVQLIGAQPYPAFESLIKEQITLAETVAKSKNLSGDALYAEVVKVNKEKAAADNDKPAAPEKPAIKPSDLPIGNSPTKGPKDAKITIVEFSDFQCPFCKRGHDTLKTVFHEEKYKDKIQVVFKNFPLNFHQHAKPAAQAALAAGKQGKFWEMYDKLFDNQSSLGSGDVFNKFATELGLNLDKFKKDFESDEIKKQIDEDQALGSKVGVNGTPAFFINGELLSGAQPQPAFEAVIDRLLQ